MSNADFEPAHSQANIWIIGHVGHGKTTLTAAIQRLSAKGLTQTWQCVEVDKTPTCPENVKGAILVVSAADGPMPQTRDHLQLARQARVPRIAVFLNKMDVADMDLVELVEMEVRALLTMCGFAGDTVTIIRGSATKALSGDDSDIGEPAIPRLMRALDKDAALIEPTPMKTPDPMVTRSGGLSGFIRRLFS